MYYMSETHEKDNYFELKCVCMRAYMRVYGKKQWGYPFLMTALSFPAVYICSCYGVVKLPTFQSLVEYVSLNSYIAAVFVVSTFDLLSKHLKIRIRSCGAINLYRCFIRI
jgi:hypothetical protein